MALKRLQYVINAFLLPVSKFIGHYENAILRSREGKGKLGFRLDMHTLSEFYFVPVYQSEKLTTKSHRKDEHGRHKIVVIALLK